MCEIKQETVVEMLKESMARGQLPFLTVTSASMHPLLSIGDQVALAPVALAHLRMGDIVVMSDGDTLVTHRFWGMRTLEGEMHLLTRGDRAAVFDKPWPAVALVAQVIARRRRGELLPLVGGAGRRLNRWLTQTAALELRVLNKFRLRGGSARVCQRVVAGWARVMCGALLTLERRRQQILPDPLKHTRLAERNQSSDSPWS
ncbi:MAG: hypothetical protein R3272_00260 [Candidatus Promineifilaceae bacterium]|nr:hypothetical protein [Candidatus Promineifilaceae bacterium]